ncbi:glycoside hydrolase family 5 protein [Pseudomonas oryzihabitans]|uniref:glycoside hydrolase family 5 protein n=1 Tax=Pseudomonas oryzihabitans TaxID=47885 RepID=UPI0021D98ED1|nr:glycoside hydrolase family 5 protein [Pseudomonas oryzihabitans]
MMNPSFLKFSRRAAQLLPFVAALTLATGAKAEQVNLVGLNLSGAGFAGQVLPGVNGTHYIFPVEAYFKQWSGKGIKLIRFPVIWERLQPVLGGPLDPTYAALVDQTFANAQKYGMRIILDLHNYTFYRGSVIGSAAVPYDRYQEIMTRIAQRWSSQPSLYAYDIMNEPHDSMAQWPIAAQYGINGVRAVDKTKPIMIEGNGWSEATRWPWWNDSLLALKDPSDNLIFQAHSYFDESAGGNYTGIDVGKLGPDYGVERVRPFVEWLKKNKKRGMIGEFGVPDNDPRWLPLMDRMLAYLKQNCIPSTYWAAGPGWGNYFLSVEPVNGADRPQWPTLKKYIDDSSCTAIGPLASGTGSTPASGTGATGGSSGSTGSSGGSSSGNSGSNSGSSPSTGTPAGSGNSGGSTTTGVTTSINDFTNEDWLHGVYRKSAGFSIPASAANVGAFKVGAQLTPADGKSYKVTYAQVVGSNMSVFIESPQLDGNAYGYPKTLKTGTTTTSGTPATVPGTTTGSTGSAGSSSSGSNAGTNTGSAAPAVTAPVVEVKPATGAGSSGSTGSTTPAAGSTTTPTGSSGTPANSAKLNLVGLNFSGAAFAPQTLPGVLNVNYIMPGEANFQQWSAKGVRLIRFPVIWERLQTRFFGSLEGAYTQQVNQVLELAKKYNMKVILALDNGGRYKGTLIGTGAVTNFNYWDLMYRLAYQWGNHAALYGYDIMGKPNGADSSWPVTAQSGIDGVRTMDRTHPVIVQGNAWGSAANWPGASNALLNLKDPANNIIYAANVYLDEDGSGSYTAQNMNNFDPQVGVNRVKPFVEWLKRNGKRGMIAEFGVPAGDSRWLAASDNLLAYLQQNCMPLTYWAAGPGWGAAALAVEPINGVERPQWPTLKKYVDASNSCTAVGPR